MSTIAQRRRVRGALAENRVQNPGDLLDAVAEGMDPAEAERWLRSVMRQADDRLDQIRIVRAVRRPGADLRSCHGCGQGFWAGSRARYCSSACRQRAYRERRPAGLTFEPGWWPDPARPKAMEA